MIALKVIKTFQDWDYSKRNYPVNYIFSAQEDRAKDLIKRGLVVKATMDDIYSPYCTSSLADMIREQCSHNKETATKDKKNIVSKNNSNDKVKKAIL